MFRDAFPIVEWGERMATLLNPDGNKIVLGQRGGGD